MNGLSDAPACCVVVDSFKRARQYVPATEGQGICSSFRRVTIPDEDIELTAVRCARRRRATC